MWGRSRKGEIVKSGRDLVGVWVGRSECEWSLIEPHRFAYKSIKAFSKK